MTLAGAVLGDRYVLDRQIGLGGFSEVWRATDSVLSRPVAVKLLNSRHAQQPRALARFQAEARHAGALCHDNIARIYDYGEPVSGQAPYLVLELIDGPSLETMLASGPLGVTRTMDIVAQAAAGLQVAHAAGLIHRDIKPANLLLAPRGVVKITDFGIARAVGSAAVTVTGELIGTPGYLAPERVSGEPATQASDIYALGMVAYVCLAGAPPFTGTPLEVALAQRERPLPTLPPAIAADVAAFVMRLTAKDPAWRTTSAAEVAAWAGLLRDGDAWPASQVRAPRGPAQARRAPAETRPGQRTGAGPLRRRMVLTYVCVALAAVVVLALASVIGFAASRPSPGSLSPMPPGLSSGRGAAGLGVGLVQPRAGSPPAGQAPAVDAATASPAERGQARHRRHGHAAGNGQTRTAGKHDHAGRPEVRSR